MGQVKFRVVRFGARWVVEGGGNIVGYYANPTVAAVDARAKTIQAGRRTDAADEPVSAAAA